MTTRVEEIASRLENLPEDYHYYYRSDIAYLLAEVKRLHEYCEFRYQEQVEVTSLALSLAEALDNARDYLAALEERITIHDADTRLDPIQPPILAVRNMEAALSDARLLKLRGEE
jgi:hypothetical protein